MAVFNCVYVAKLAIILKKINLAIDQALPGRVFFSSIV
jgi:hypothetical protein